jgi:hypothetical protein
MSGLRHRVLRLSQPQPFGPSKLCPQLAGRSDPDSRPVRRDDPAARTGVGDHHPFPWTTDTLLVAAGEKPRSPSAAAGRPTRSIWASTRWTFQRRALAGVQRPADRRFRRPSAAPAARPAGDPRVAGHPPAAFSGELYCSSADLATRSGARAREAAARHRGLAAGRPAPDPHQPRAALEEPRRGDRPSAGHRAAGRRRIVRRRGARRPLPAPASARQRPLRGRQSAAVDVRAARREQGVRRLPRAARHRREHAASSSPWPCSAARRPSCCRPATTSSATAPKPGSRATCPTSARSGSEPSSRSPCSAGRRNAGQDRATAPNCFSGSVRTARDLTEHGKGSWGQTSFFVFCFTTPRRRAMLCSWPDLCELSLRARSTT